MRRRWTRYRILASLLLAVLLVSPASAILFYTFLPSNGAGDAVFTSPRQVNAADVAVPPGYCIEPVVTGLTYPTAVITESSENTMSSSMICTITALKLRAMRLVVAPSSTSSPVTGSRTTPSDSARSSRSRGRVTAASPRSTSVTRASSASCCATPPSRSSSHHWL